MTTAKIFWSGRSQAVRIPKEFRLPGDEVVIRRVGTSLVLEPIDADWSWIDRVHGTGSFDLEAAEAATEHVEWPARSEAEEHFSP